MTENVCLAKFNKAVQERPSTLAETLLSSNRPAAYYWCYRSLGENNIRGWRRKWMMMYALCERLAEWGLNSYQSSKSDLATE